MDKYKHFNLNNRGLEQIARVEHLFNEFERELGKYLSDPAEIQTDTHNLFYKVKRQIELQEKNQISDLL